MHQENSWGDECFYCEFCEKPFRSPLYDISKGYEHTIFFDSPLLPEIEIIGSEVIANYCSPICRETHLSQILKRENIQATYPGVGLIESCARCHCRVLMTSFHLAFVQTETEHSWDQSMFGVDTISSKVITVVCNKCAPIPLSIARAVDWDD